MTPSWLRPVPQGVELRILVQPRASRDQVAGEQGDELKVRLTAPPVEGKANEALLKFLAKRLGIPKGRLELAAGDHGRNKLIRIHGLAGDEVYDRLGVAPPPACPPG